MKNCPLCRVIEDEVQVHRLFETDEMLAFLSLNPVNPGHCLLVPKVHFNSFTSMDTGLQGRLFNKAVEISQHLQRICKGDAFNIHIGNGDAAGQGLLHSHIHLIPRAHDDGFFWNWRMLDLTEAENDGIAKKF
ncbi:MAG: HIT family protein, partial [Lentisphaeria bacterium]|nr:HIT family protein [Lentisphaeria bacterium]